MSNDALRTLTDKSEIIDVFNRYATGIDQRDEALFRACFVEDLQVEMEGVEPITGGATQWVDLALSAVGGYETTHHIVTNHDIRIDGDQATGVAYLQAQHWNPDSSFLVGGYYTNEFRRTNDGWRISKLTLKVTWTKPG
ncbi:MAG: nuclear transport factor 2 family protein [Candidatus Binatia bacterium]|nr:nuclear transport factor 2 family protein [Candidatus Binatia bacterium]